MTKRDYSDCLGPVQQPTYTEAFESLVTAEIPAALADKKVADAEKERVEIERINAEARRRIKNSAEKAVFEANVQLRMAQLLSTDETMSARIQQRSAELSGLF
jgi:hypothetical protein